MNTQYLCVAALLFPAGLLLFSGAVFNSDWLFNMRRAQLWVRLLGRHGAQIAFGIIGGGCMLMGMLLAAGGFLNVNLQQIGQPPPGQVIDGGIRYERNTIYLLPPPQGYVPGSQQYSRYTSTYQQFANGNPDIRWNGVNEQAKSINTDVLALIARSPDFSTGWVLIRHPHGGTDPVTRIHYEFMDVRSPTDWTMAKLTSPMAVDLGLG